MECEIYIGDELIGKAVCVVIDEGMGAIGGELLYNENYTKYQKEIQKHYEEKGISNSEDFNFRIIIKRNIKLEPQGGIGIIDSKEYNEILVEAAGVDLLLFN